MLSLIEIAHYARELCIFCKDSMDNSVLQQSFTQHDFRVIIKFHVLLKKTPTDIFHLMSTALGEHCPSYETIRKWTKLISEGKVDMDDEIRSGRPTSASNPEHVIAAPKVFTF
jgi:hypothetical protein